MPQHHLLPTLRMLLHVHTDLDKMRDRCAEGAVRADSWTARNSTFVL